MPRDNAGSGLLTFASARDTRDRASSPVTGGATRVHARARSAASTFVWRRAALEQLVASHDPWIFNVAARMVWRRDDAADATQEVLVKVMTRLSTFRGESSGDAPTDDEPGGVPAALLVEEAKIGCTLAMLMCLDRRQRVVFVLGEIRGVTDRVGAEVTELSPENFRQVLARARRDLYSFMNDKCGLVNEANPCRCARKTRGFIEKGYVEAGQPLLWEKASEARLAAGMEAFKRSRTLGQTLASWGTIFPAMTGGARDDAPRHPRRSSGSAGCCRRASRRAGARCSPVGRPEGVARVTRGFRRRIWPVTARS